jgi:iron complex outermembrane recepter protein
VTAGYTSGGPPLQETALGDKTDTKIGDLPQSVVIVPRSLAVEQSNLNVATAISRDVSGVNQGGSSSYGFFESFTIRGMDARIYEDNFPDGDQSN